MKYSAIKWIGTVVVVGLGLYIAVSMTYKWKVTEEKAYRLSLPEHSFVLKDGRQLRVTMSMVFKNNKDAEDAENKRQNLTELLITLFKDADSSSFGSGNDIEVSKAKFLIELKKSGYSVEYISFDTFPRIF